MSYSNMFELYADMLDGREFNSVEEFDAEVELIANDVEEDLGRAERWALTHDPDVYDQLGVTIKGVYPEEEDE